MNMMRFAKAMSFNGSAPSSGGITINSRLEDNPSKTEIVLFRFRTFADDINLTGILGWSMFCIMDSSSCCTDIPVNTI